MSSILRKAMWPAALIVGMFVLIGAFGTAKAPTAHAAPLDLCAIVGPFPDVEDQVGGNANDVPGIVDDGILLVGETYLFVIYTEDAISAGAVQTVEIDDEEGDADITSFLDDALDAAGAAGADFVGDTYRTIPGVDVRANIPVLNNITASADDALDAAVDDDFVLDLTATGCGITGIGEVADAFIIVDVTCEDPGRFEMTVYDGLVPENSITGEYLCMAPPKTATITATPTTVESNPALGNISHSLIVVTLVDAFGNPAWPASLVDWSTTKCQVEARDENQYEGATGDGALFAAYRTNNPSTAGAINDHASGGSHSPPDTSSLSFLNDSDPGSAYVARTIAVAMLHCENATPGVATVTAEIDIPGAVDIKVSTDVTVVGPPAFITMTAAPSKLVCGEKATILVTVTDAINQKVSDHTVVELITNYGGVLGGTGATLGLPGVNPVTPLSSGAAETFGGVATAYLLTSSNHVGAYEVVAAAGGSNLGSYYANWSWGEDDGTYFGQNGVFSTPVVTSQVTVTCTAGAPAVTAPSTGTGSISPPNTGDAGLAAASSSNASLFVILGAVAFVLAGLASFGYARR